MNATASLFKKIVLSVIACFCFMATSAYALGAKLDTQKIEQLTGLKGKYNEQEGVFTVTLPRNDLKVTVAGVKMNPTMGLTAWAAFTRTGEHTMVMGDLVLREDQVNPVMIAALDNGLEVTALHNHFFWDSPKIWFMHIGGMGDEEKLASAVGQTFNKLKETITHKPKIPHVAIDPAKTTLHPKIIDDIMRTSGDLKNGVYKITIGRTVKMEGHEMGKAMGINTWAAFAGSDQQAVVDGDFATFPNELQSVLKALRSAGIYIVAIHNHMTTEEPRLIFLHFWGIGSTANLAKGIKAALDTQG